jgi:hypothetical protein
MSEVDKVSLKVNCVAAIMSARAPLPGILLMD